MTRAAGSLDAAMRPSSRPPRAPIPSIHMKNDVVRLGAIRRLTSVETYGLAQTIEKIAIGVIDGLMDMAVQRPIGLPFFDELTGEASFLHGIVHAEPGFDGGLVEKDQPRVVALKFLSLIEKPGHVIDVGHGMAANRHIGARYGPRNRRHGNVAGPCPQQCGLAVIYKALLEIAHPLRRGPKDRAVHPMKKIMVAAAPNQRCSTREHVRFPLENPSLLPRRIGRDEDVQKVTSDRHHVERGGTLSDPVELRTIAMKVRNEKEFHEITIADGIHPFLTGG